MIGELKLEPVDPGASRLTLSGTYRPPFGPLGREIDAVLQHVAETTIRNFAERVSARFRNRRPAGSEKQSDLAAELDERYTS